ncbi:MAG: hypothetical protein WC061_08170, partial [Melioribacteraceae bacterium]
MKNILVPLILLLTFNLAAQSGREEWINGFSKRVAGENLEYHSCHPDANLALLIRCNNDNDFIEWETASVPDNYEKEFITFVWIAGYSTATSTASHTFRLYLNDKHLFNFTTGKNDRPKDWEVENSDGSSLSFKFVKLDAVDDFFGYFYLTIPRKKLTPQKNVLIKIKGDATGSKDWYMTMQYPLAQMIRITPEKIVS